MKLTVAFVASAFAILVAEAVPQGGYSGSSFGVGSGGYTLGGGNSIGGAPSQGYSAPGGFGGSAPGQSYGAPGSGGGSSSAPGQGYGAPGANSFGDNGSGSDAASQGPQVFRYISVHAAPADPDDEAQKIVRIPGGNNKHVNIIFVKAPSNGADQKTEIVLPDADEHKNLVYVLVKKTDPTANLKIKRPEPTKPPKPEVYFIRYKNAPQQQQGSGQGGSGANGIGGYSRDASVNAGQFSAGPSSGYGAPSSQYGSP